MRLRTVSCQAPGWRRVRSGRGFRYVDQAGGPVSDAAAARIRGLAIPPAWTDVWICPDERGHLQAVGTDAAGRRQYLYHPRWRELRDVAKFDRVLTMARQLPRVRRDLAADLRQTSDARHRVLAAGVRLVDLGCFRLGAESYTEEYGTHGLTTLERRHVRKDGNGFSFSFTGKAGVEHQIRIDDPAVCRVVSEITARRRSSSPFLASKVNGLWRPVSAEEFNAYLRDHFRSEVSAKDFRTWHATVTVAVALASEPPARSKTGRSRQVRAALVEASDLLGNTPAVARGSYVDPRVLDLFESGTTLQAVPGDQCAADRAVVKLLSG